MLLEEQKKNKSFNGENCVQKIIETSFINKSEIVLTEPALPYNAKANSSEKLNYSDIACDVIKERNKLLKKEISIKEKQLADLSTPNNISIKNIYNIKDSVTKGIPLNPSYIVEQEINKGINNINNHNNIIIQNNIQNVIKGPYELPKYNPGHLIPISPVIQDLRYRPVIISENKIAKIQNIAPHRASPPANA